MLESNIIRENNNLLKNNRESKNRCEFLDQVLIYFMDFQFFKIFSSVNLLKVNFDKINKKEQNEEIAKLDNVLNNMNSLPISNELEIIKKISKSKESLVSELDTKKVKIKFLNFFLEFISNKSYCI